MKIVLNTSKPNAACSVFYRDALQRLPEISFNDYDYSKYDVALIMTYDHTSVASIKQKYPHLKIGIVDPRNYKVIPSSEYCDFLIIDSIEMEDYWRVADKPLFKYVEYPNIPLVQKIHSDGDKIIIGYHGNQIHLDCMANTVTPALSELGKKYNIELLVMHNGRPPSGKEMWYPQNCMVRHIPWSMDNYINELAKSDIGIVPNNMVHDTSLKHITKTNHSFNFSDDDYSLRFKMPSNPGRFAIFGKLNIPVIADFYPSALQYLGRYAGSVAHNPSGWKYCLEQLIKSSSLRQLKGDLLQQIVIDNFDFDLQNKK